MTAAPDRQIRHDAYRTLAHADAQPARLGNSRLILIDGPGGSGKTTLSRALASIRPHTTTVVHLDDLYPGWTGLRDVHRLLPTLVSPMAAGHGGHYRRFDWYLDQVMESVFVPPRPIVVVEGCGAGLRALAPLTSTLVWVEAPPATRDRRGEQRGGVGIRENWRAWSLAERALAVREQTRSRADVTFTNR